MPSAPASSAAATTDPSCIVIGAGIAGLACAQRLHRQGVAVTVLERSRGVGGRCASWRHDGGLFDYGVSFLHGRHPEFIAALEAVPARRLDGWPQRVHGRGAPCQPRAFEAGERRLAYAEGVSAFAKALAAALPAASVHQQCPVVALHGSDDGWRVDTEGGASFTARTLVLALAVEQSVALLQPLCSAHPRLAAVLGLSELLPSVATLALMVTYDTAPELPWDIDYPEAGDVLQLIANETSKRPFAGGGALVLQARPAWSRAHLAAEPAQWSQAMLTAAAQRLGPWAAQPRWQRPHRWRFARHDLASELSQPLLFELAPGRRLGITGELFGRGVGVEGAWLAGRALADRLLGSTDTLASRFA